MNTAHETILKVIHELTYYNPATDEYKGEHIHKVWARELTAAYAMLPYPKQRGHLGSTVDGGIDDHDEPSPTANMGIAGRILHVGGRNNAAGYVEFGSTQAVEAFAQQLIRDLKPQIVAEARAALSPASPAPAVPSGWNLVPSADLERLHASIHGQCYMGEDWERKAVSALLSATPAQQTQSDAVAGAIGPMRTAPAAGVDYWRLTPTGGWLHCWAGDTDDFAHLKNGLAFADRPSLEHSQKGGAHGQ